MSMSTRRLAQSGSSTGLIIAALIVVLGILFVLSFDWSGTSNHAGRNG